MRKLVYNSTGPLIAAAVVFRLVFCPAGLCANTVAQSWTEDSSTHTSAPCHDTQDNSSDTKADALIGSPNLLDAPLFDPSKSKDSDSRASCCNDETVSEAPFTPALASPVLIFQRLAVPEIHLTSGLSGLLEEPILSDSSPGIPLHIQNQQFLN
ncbi:MAG: hypothetical protein RH862_00940 [Leptospiraceae bacterium]